MKRSVNSVSSFILCSWFFFFQSLMQHHGEIEMVNTCIFIRFSLFLPLPLFAQATKLWKCYRGLSKDRRLDVKLFVTLQNRTWLVHSIHYNGKIHLQLCNSKSLKLFSQIWYMRFLLLWWASWLKKRHVYSSPWQNIQIMSSLFMFRTYDQSDIKKCRLFWKLSCPSWAMLRGFFGGGR